MPSPTPTTFEQNAPTKKESADSALSSPLTRFSGKAALPGVEPFNSLFYNSALGIAIAYPNGDLGRVNPALCKLLGYREKELLQRRLQTILAPDQWYRLAIAFENICIGKQKNAQFSVAFRRREGKTIHGLLDLSRVVDDATNPCPILIQIKDISSLIRAESELEQNLQWYRALYNSTLEAVFIFSKHVCIDANQTASTMFGIPQENLIGILGADIIASEYLERFNQPIISDDELPYRAIAIKKNGSRFHVIIQSKRVRIRNNNYRVTMIRDIDAQVKVEAALRESERHLRSLMESASNFALFRLRNNLENPCQPQSIFISPSIGEIADLDEVTDFQSWLKVIHPDDTEPLLDTARQMLETHRMDRRVRIQGSGGRGWRWLHIICVAVTDEIDNSLFFNGIILDITSEVEATAALKARESELKERTESLFEVNTALEVLLRKREADRFDVEEKMLSNAKNLILPYLEKLKASRLDDRQRTYLNLIESNLNELISPLSQRVSHHYFNLTPLEIQVADLVKEGKTTKEIAQILGRSIRTIESVRYTIRRKLGLKKKRSSLRSHLISIDGANAMGR